MKALNDYNLMLQILDILSDDQLHHINNLIEKIVLVNNISIKDKNKLIQTNNEELNIKSFDQHIQIALTHLLVFELINADKNWNFNIEYTTSYKVTDQGLKFIAKNKNASNEAKISQLKMKMKTISESLKTNTKSN
jgi:hypothetical protein